MLSERRQFWQQKPTVFCTLLLWLHAGYETECVVVGTNMTELRLSIQYQSVAALDENTRRVEDVRREARKPDRSHGISA